VIGLLLRLYPGRWRERYGEELKDLVTETGLGAAAAADIARAAARERQRSAELALAGGVTMTIGPAWRHPTGWAVVAFAVMAPTLVFVIGSLLAYQLGIGIFANAMDSVTTWLNAQPRLVDLVLVAAPALALLIALLPILKVNLSSGDGGEFQVGVRLRWFNLLVGLIALAIGGLLVWHIVWESVLQVGG
jgi:hypothetical protein